MSALAPAVRVRLDSGTVHARRLVECRQGVWVRLEESDTLRLVPAEAVEDHAFQLSRQRLRLLRLLFQMRSYRWLAGQPTGAWPLAYLAQRERPHNPTPLSERAALSLVAEGLVEKVGKTLYRITRTGEREVRRRAVAI